MLLKIWTFKDPCEKNCLPQNPNFQISMGKSKLNRLYEKTEIIAGDLHFLFLFDLHCQKTVRDMLIFAVRHISLSMICPLFCPEHISKTTKGINMKLHRWIDLNQGEVRCILRTIILDFIF